MGVQTCALPISVVTLSAAADALGQAADLAATWEAGGKIKFDGMDLEHSMLLLRQPGEHGRLVERLWQAQAGELLPLLELSLLRTLAQFMNGKRAVNPFADPTPMSTNGATPAAAKKPPNKLTKPPSGKAAPSPNLQNSSGHKAMNQSKSEIFQWI